jgi:hypothetical protein
MALQTSGAISLNDIHIEAGGSTATSAGINDADIIGLIDKTAGAAMSFSEWYGASALLTLATQSSATTSSTNNITITIPSFAAGDIAIAVATIHDSTYANSNTINVPAGWTALGSTVRSIES